LAFFPECHQLNSLLLLKHAEMVSGQMEWANVRRIRTFAMIRIGRNWCRKNAQKHAMFVAAPTIDEEPEQEAQQKAPLPESE
jgi:hypothetical protein